MQACRAGSSAVPTGPRPRSSLASTITPSAGAVGIGGELEHLGLQRDRLEQLVEAGLLQRRDLDLERVAAQAFDDDLVAAAARCARAADRRLACRSC